ncbi:MBL fold metallo-hydrolase [Spirosoma endbachense]|uniref:MBL fold metallo-hydrolase n=1 Tax=Spirosoma endbachense TaxID=2666025 RepID=A0A6P1VRB5_9BACT|nr:MBL fold metallo-hydrolase [Spirosoma endbachense]QHV94530.1 MBL fold metallo-hydrolase [Spirosoma endbachense]
MLKPAFQKDDTLLADIETARNHPESLHIWWLGQSGFLVQYNGKQLLFDPYLSDSLSEKYAHTDKPHVRISERVIQPGHLGMIDVVTSSHNHTDHLDYNTLFPLFAANWQLQLVIPEANRTFVTDRLGIAPDQPIGLNDSQTVPVGGFIFHGVPAAHNELERDAEGRCKFMGFVVEIGPYRVYHSGDTLWYDGMVDILKPFKVDVAFLPINGNKPERRVAGNLNPNEAARLGRDIEAKLVIPHHYDLFEFNTADPADFVKACEQYGTPYRVMQLGEGISID